MLQLLSPAELQLPFSGQVEIDELETHARQIVDANVIGDAYRASVREFLDRCRLHALRDGIDYALITTDTPPEQSLRDYLLRRSRRQAAGHTRSVEPR